MDIRLVASLGLGVATNLDNFGVGSAYGINRIRIGHLPNMLIATFNAGATGISMLCGALIAKILSNYRGLHHSTLNLRDDRCLSHSIAAFLADAEPAKQTFSIAPH